MICPNCGTRIADTDEVCPACRTNVAEYLERQETIGMSVPAPRLRYCGTCGALLASEDEICPKCGTPYGGNRMRQTGEVPGFLPKSGPSQDPQLESALPAEKIYQEEVGWQGVSSRRILIAVVLAIAVLSAAVALITFHPWDTGERPSEVQSPDEAEPLVIERLTGQDSKRPGYGVDGS